MNLRACTVFFCFFAIFTMVLFSESTFIDSHNRLRLYDDDETQTVISRSGRGLGSRIIVDGERYVQKNYDERQRVVREIIFFAPSVQKNIQEVPKAVPAENTGENSVKEPVKESVEQRQPPAYALLTEPSSVIEYEYEGEQPYARKVTETDFTAERKTETIYERENLLSRETVYALAHGEQKEQQLSHNEWLYDDKDRIVQKKTDLGGRGSSVVYTWHEKHVKPDQSLYENGLLISENIFASDGTKKEEILYFPDELVVKNLYSGGKKTAEIIFNNGRMVREKKIEGID